MKSIVAARAIFHVVRWHTHMQTQSTDGFKICNNHSKRYAKLLMGSEPETFSGFFRRREPNQY